MIDLKLELGNIYLSYVTIQHPLPVFHVLSLENSGNIFFIKTDI